MHAIGIDVGGSSVKGAIVSENSSVIYPRAGGEVLNRPTTQEARDASRDEIVSTVFTTIDELVEHYPNDPLRIGIGIAGIVSKDGIVVAAANSQKDYTGTDWRKLLLDRYERRGLKLENLVVERDVIGSTIAEWERVHTTRSQKSNLENDILLNVAAGTGIGVGAVLNQRILRGVDNFSLEVGHIPVSIEEARNGKECYQNVKGCFELYATSRAIASYIQDNWSDSSYNLKDRFGQAAGVTRHEIWALGNLADAGDSLCQQAFLRAGEYLGFLLVSLIHTFNPSFIVIGGGVPEATRYYSDAAISFAKEHSLEPCRKSLGIYRSELGASAAAIGFARMAMRNISVML